MKILKFDPGGSYKLKKLGLIATIFILIASFLFGSEARQWQVAADNPDSLVFHSGFEMGDFGEWSGGVTGEPSVLLAFTKPADPETLPPGNANGAAFTSNGTYLAIAHYTTPFVTIYEKSGDTFTKLADPETLPPGIANGAAFTSNGTYLAIAHSTTPFVTIYKRSGDTFTKLTDPETLPPGTSRGAAFTSDGTYLAIAHIYSPFVTIYKRSGDTFTKLTDPETLPLGNANGAAFTSDGTYLAIAHYITPFVTIYKRSGDTFTKLTDPETLPPDTSRGAAFTSNGTYLAIAHYTTPFVTIYERSGDTFTKLADPETLPPDTSRGAAFTSNGTYLAMAHSTTPFVTIYERSGDTFTKLADPETLPPGTSHGAAFTSNGTYLAIAHVNSPYVTIYIKAQPKTGECVMRCSPVAATAYVDSGKGTMAKLTFYLLIRTAPNNDCYIAGDSANGGIKLTTTGELDLYSGGDKQDGGTTPLALNTWYRVSWLQDTDNTYIKLNGNTECSFATSVPINSQIGVIIDEVTATLYFDDFACDNATGPTDIGDIRVLRSSPNAAGNYTDFDKYVGLATHWKNVDEVPASDDDYVQHAGTSQAHEIYNVQSCSDIGIGASDTIEAVSSWFRMKRSGGSGTYHAHMVRDDGTDYESADLDLAATYAWWNRYDAIMPNGGAAWTQARVDAFQAGFSHYDTGGQDTFGSCVMVMVAYSPYIIQEVALSAEKTTTDTGNTVLYQGETDQWMGTFGFVHNKATGDTITGVNITLDGSAVPADIDTISLYKDSDSTYDGGETSFGSSTCSNVKTSITGSMSVSTTMTYLHVVFNITSGATADNTEGAKIAADADVTFSGASTLTDAPKTLGTGTITLSLSSAIEIRSQNYTSPVSTITFPEAAPGAVVSNPYNDQGETQTLGGSSSPVVTLVNTSASFDYNIWYNITPFTPNIVSSENYVIIAEGGACVDAAAINQTATLDSLDHMTTGTITTINAAVPPHKDDKRDLYLKITLSEVAGKSGTSTLTILGETA